MKDKNPLGGGASSQSKSLKLIVTEVLPARQDQDPRSHQLNLLESDSATVQLGSNSCSTCHSKLAIQIAGVGPHFAGLRCASCNRFLQWLAKPKKTEEVSA